jgi:16S rRNA processing protein RimM
VIEPSEGEIRVAVGRIVAPHGVRGEVRLLPYHPDPGRYRALRDAWVGDVRRQIVEAHAHGQLIRLKLEGVDDRGAAERLCGLEVTVPRSKRAPLPAGRYYVDDLVGLQVVDLSGRFRGTVSNVESLPGQDLLHVRLPQGGRDALVPMVRAFVRNVDLTQGRVTVDAMKGLFPEEAPPTSGSEWHGGDTGPDGGGVG